MSCEKSRRGADIDSDRWQVDCTDGQYQQLETSPTAPDASSPRSHATASQTTGSFRHCAQTSSLQQHKTVFLQRFPSVFYKHRQLTTLLIDVLCLSVARSFSRCAQMDFTRCWAPAWKDRSDSLEMLGISRGYKQPYIISIL